MPASVVWYMCGMRWVVTGLMLAAACGDPSVRDRIDAIRRSGARFAHETLPSPQRTRERSPDGRGTWQEGIRSDLWKNSDAAALLRMGDAAVPDLARLLEDRERGPLAAVFLGEIGGKGAAAALLARWRELRGEDQQKRIYRYQGEAVYAEGFTYERVDMDAYGEMIASLCYTGREVGKEIAADTAAAMDESERLQREGKDLAFEEWRDEEDGKKRLMWDAEPVETACEGLQFLAMAGAPEGVDLFVRGLQSPVRAIRWAAIQEHTWLEVGRDRTMPLLGGLLDDPEWRVKAVEELSSVLPGVSFVVDPSPDEAEELASRYRRKLQELGYLPR